MAGGIGRRGALGSLSAFPRAAGIRAILLILVLGASAQPLLPDISGMYRAFHPRRDWGEVLVLFNPLPSGENADAGRYPVYSVSIWKETGGLRRKLRDGLFGSFTRAVLARQEGGLAVRWMDPTGAKRPIVDDASVEEGCWIRLGGQELEYLGPPPEDERRIGGWMDMAGVYAYRHPSTGAVLVHFFKTEEAPPFDDSRISPVYGIRSLREMPGMGYARTGEGLFGGSRPNDEFTRVAVSSRGGEAWLVWWNPARRGKEMRTRILSLYANGDIGIASEGEASRYLEEGRFERVAGAEARVDRPSGFLSLEGLYVARSLIGGTEAYALLRPRGPLAVDEKAYSVDTVSLGPDGPVVLYSGLFPDDHFDAVRVGDADGRILLTFFSSEGGLEEVCAATGLDPEGNFSLSGAGRSGDDPFYRFTKVSGSPPSRESGPLGAAE